MLHAEKKQTTLSFKKKTVLKTDSEDDDDSDEFKIEQFSDDEDLPKRETRRKAPKV